MRKEDLASKTTELINQAHRSMLDNLDRAIESGCMDIEKAEDNYILPKALFLALLKEEQHSVGLPYGWRKAFKKSIDKIFAIL